MAIDKTSIIRKNQLPQQHTISVIIPIYNEEKSLFTFLQKLCAFKNIDEIICVNDGSEDCTADILRCFSNQVHCIHFQTNQGKGSALAAGVRACHGDIVVFLDADLLNLTQTHFQLLINPLLEKKKKAVIGYCKSSEFHFVLTEFISGQRAYFKNDLLPYLDEMECMRYGVEMFLNSLLHPFDVEFVPLMDLRSIYKFEKYDSSLVAKQYYLEGKEIVQSLPKTVLTKRFAGLLLDRFRDILPVV